ncbi:hypothetical protein ENSA5_59920 [Enhygromyxa salina]|uniref:Uncharacterized protein n=1 Tax=Enhygromyxa salina TaxID=215803 RepID=A0A2S9XDI5_9BACT|nr:hypothetical protein [Enhygromyxa salina]PRP90917.1 hypothetical protein ENSA5_59920 [Enhygromyxa salina]
MLGLLAPMLGCGAHLYRAHDDEVSSSAAATAEGLDWSQSFANDRAQRDELDQREAELSWSYAHTRRDAELFDVLNESVGERSWAKLELGFVELAACLLEGVDSARACRGSGTDAELERARALVFDDCSGDSCAWIDALGGLRGASAALREQLAAYDRARALAGRSIRLAPAAQCPVPTRVPSALDEDAKLLERACDGYELALARVAAALPEDAGLRGRIERLQRLIAARDRYRRQLRMAVAQLSPQTWDQLERPDPDGLPAKAVAYDELQRELGLELARARAGDYSDLGLEGTLLIAREHYDALVRVIAVPVEIYTSPLPLAEDAAPGADDPGADDGEGPGEASDWTIVEELGRELGPVFGEAWVELQSLQARAERTTLLFSAEVERVQIDAISRRLALANARVLLELGTVETELFALSRLRARLRDDWIPATRPSSPAREQLDRRGLALQVAEAALGEAEEARAEAAAKTRGNTTKLVEATRRVAEAQAGFDAASDAYAELIAEHGAVLCRRSGTVLQSWLRDGACIEPIERLVSLHTEMWTVVVPRLESLQRGVARRHDEAELIRAEAGLKIRVTYIAASVAALQRFNAGGLEGQDLAAIVGAVVGVGLGTAIAAGVYIP